MNMMFIVETEKVKKQPLYSGQQKKKTNEKEMVIS